MSNDPQHKEKGYAFSLENIDCLRTSTRFNVVMDLEESILDLLPLLASVLPGCTYIHGTDVISLMDSGHIIGIYPGRITFTGVSGLDEGKTLCRTYFEKISEVKENKNDLTPVYRKKPTIQVIHILRCLPRTNCGVCGHPTCMAFAAKVFQREALISACIPFMEKVETNGEFLYELQKNGYEVPVYPQKV